MNLESLCISEFSVAPTQFEWTKEKQIVKGAKIQFESLR